MERAASRNGILALALAAVALLVGRSGVVDWPAAAAESLAGLLALVGMTRVVQWLGGRDHAAARAIIVGIAGTAVVWFGGAAVMTGRPGLGLLAVCHGAVALLAWWRAPGDPTVRSVTTLAAGGALVLSLLAVASLPEGQRPGVVWVPSFLAAGVIVAVYLCNRGSEAARLPLGVIAVIAAIYAARALAHWEGPEAPPALMALAAGTMALAALPLIVEAARQLPEVIGRRAPRLTPTMRGALAVLLLPAVGALAAALLLAAG
jgi:hypothetical protein